MRSLLELSLAKIMKEFSLKEAIDFLKGHGSILSGNEQMLNTKKGILKLVSFCNVPHKEMIINSIRGRFDHDTKEEWASYLLSLSEEKMFEYGYKYKGRFCIEEDEDFESQYDPNLHISVPNHFFNPGLLVEPFKELEGENFYRTPIPGLLPKAYKIGVHIEINIIFAKCSEKVMHLDEYPFYLKGGKKVSRDNMVVVKPCVQEKFDLIFWLSSHHIFDRVTVEFLNILSERVRSRCYPFLKPGHCTLERWDDDGNWNFRNSRVLSGWKDFEDKTLELIMEPSSDSFISVLFANPGFNHEMKDTNQITVLMEDNLSLFQIAFNCTMLKTN